MATWIALLRGINVGGGNRLPMAALREQLEALESLNNVRTYIQSGNIVFESGLRSAAALGDLIGDTIEQEHGFRPRTMMLRPKDLQQAVEQNPFPAAISEPKTLHFYFLAEPPKSPNLAALDGLKSDTEQYQLLGRVFYLYTPDGLSKSKLAEKVEKHLGVAATARNFNSVDAILKMTS